MSLRTRLVVFLLLFGTAVLANIISLLYLARSLSLSLDVMERIQQGQLVAVQMNAHLRDSEAALYRYQINGEPGFKVQFAQQLKNFANDLENYRTLAISVEELAWVVSLQSNYQQAQRTGTDLIALRDRQTANLQAFLNAHAQLSGKLLKSIYPAQQDDAGYQFIKTQMLDTSRTILTAVNDYVASPDETRRVQFTDAAIGFRQALNQFRALEQTADEKHWSQQVSDDFSKMENLGLQLIGTRDLQQSLFANFFAIIFNAGQQTIVGKIQPYETTRLAREQSSLLQAVDRTIGLGIIIPVIVSVLAVIFMSLLSRKITLGVDALLSGAEGVARGDLRTRVVLAGRDEFARLAESFNNMTNGIFSREERLRSLISRMAQIQDEERRLIGLDLHDGLTQIIISANMHLNALKAIATPRLDQAAEQELDMGRSLVKQAIDEARKVISELRPSLVEDFGLNEGLRRYVNDVCEIEKWDCILEVETGEIQVGSPVDAAIFRIAQEALTNIRKHARTRKIWVGFKVVGPDLVLRVQDWGQGFNISAFQDESQHLGLFSMQERAEMLGGSCRIESQPGLGTTVQVNLPLSVLMEKKNE